MAARDWWSPVIGAAAALGTALIPGGAPFAPFVGAAAGAASSGITTAASGGGKGKSKSCSSGKCGNKKHPQTPHQESQGQQGQPGNPLGIQQQSLLTPQQQPLHDEAIKQSLSLLQGNNAPGFGPIAENARKQFQTTTLPSLAERFTTLGASAQDPQFAAAGLAAGTDLESQLAMLQGGYNQSMLQMLLPYGLRHNTENILPQQEESRPPIGAQGLAQGSADLTGLLGALTQQWQEGSAQKGQQQESPFDLSKYNPKNVNPLLSPEALARNNPMYGGQMNRLGGSAQQFSKQYGLGAL